jgi:hypothetical protein
VLVLITCRRTRRPDHLWGRLTGAIFAAASGALRLGLRRSLTT